MKKGCSCLFLELPLFKRQVHAPRHRSPSPGRLPWPLSPPSRSSGPLRGATLKARGASVPTSAPGSWATGQETGRGERAHLSLPPGPQPRVLPLLAVRPFPLSPSRSPLQRQLEGRMDTSGNPGFQVSLKCSHQPLHRVV